MEGNQREERPSSRSGPSNESSDRSNQGHNGSWKLVVSRHIAPDEDDSSGGCQLQVGDAPTFCDPFTAISGYRGRAMSAT